MIHALGEDGKAIGEDGTTKISLRLYWHRQDSIVGHRG